MLRVAMISPLFESVPPKLYGGTERIVFQLCQGLTDQDVEVVLFASGDSLVECSMHAVIPEGLRLKQPPVNDSLAYHYKMMAQVAKQAPEFDVIHNHSDYWMFPLTEMTQTPILSTLHGRLDLPDSHAAYCSFPKGHLISISDAQRKPLPDLPWLSTIYHGLDLEKFKFHPKPGQYLAFLGRISEEKKPEWAIQIAKHAGVPLKIAAKIEGALGQDYYSRLVKPHVDGKFIEYIGEISEHEKSEFLGNALALVFPIDWPEPFGLVMIEALACGTPVLARPYGSVPEILKDGVTGFVHSDLEVLAQKVGRLSQISRLECRQWVNERFSLQRMTEDYIDVYRKLATTQGIAAHHRRNFLHPLKRAAFGDS